MAFAELGLKVNKTPRVKKLEKKLRREQRCLSRKYKSKIYFIASPSKLKAFPTKCDRTFSLTEDFLIVELELSPTLKRELRRRSPQNQLDAKKNQIRQTLYKLNSVAQKFGTLPPQARKNLLDEYISELVLAEKILNEIFPEIHSDTLKLNLNMFKEFLIDLRLYEDLRMKQLTVEDLNRQIKILAQDLETL